MWGGNILYKYVSLHLGRVLATHVHFEYASKRFPTMSSDYIDAQ